jgi:hypothetical protein
LYCSHCFTAFENRVSPASSSVISPPKNINVWGASEKPNRPNQAHLTKNLSVQTTAYNRISVRFIS